MNAAERLPCCGQPEIGLVWYRTRHTGSTWAVCKTVGFAFGGSNPPPATTCENGPLAASTRLCGPFPSRHAMYQGVSLRVDAWQCPRTYSGQRPGKTSGAYNRSLCYPNAVGSDEDAVGRRVGCQKSAWPVNADSGSGPSFIAALAHQVKRDVCRTVTWMCHLANAGVRLLCGYTSPRKFSGQPLRAAM